MNEETNQPSPRSPAAEAESERGDRRVSFDPEAICDVCGATGAYGFGDQRLCEDCYVKSSSCCPEFGREETD